MSEVYTVRNLLQVFRFCAVQNKDLTEIETERKNILILKCFPLGYNFNFLQGFGLVKKTPKL